MRRHFNELIISLLYKIFNQQLLREKYSLTPFASIDILIARYFHTLVYMFLCSRSNTFISWCIPSAFSPHLMAAIPHFVFIIHFTWINKWILNEILINIDLIFLRQGCGSDKFINIITYPRFISHRHLRTLIMDNFWSSLHPNSCCLYYDIIQW